MQQQPSPPHSPSQIKEILLRALDRDYHVVDMALALEAVSLLEKTNVTKEALETTRLGRLVNEMRKKTANDSLARRAKDLVRRWRDMVSKPSENGTGGTGQGPGTVQITGLPLNHLHHLKVSGLKNSASSPALIDMGRTTSSSSSPALLRPVHTMASTSPAFRGVSSALSSPALQHRNKPGSGHHNNQQSSRLVISPTNSVASNTSTSPGLSFFNNSNSSRPSTPSLLVVKSKAVSPGPGRPETASNNNQRAVKRPRDNDEETMTGFEPFNTKRTKASTNGGIALSTTGSEWPWTDECSRDSNLSCSGDSLRMTGHHQVHHQIGEDRSMSSSSKTSRHHVRSGKATSDVLKEKFASIARVSKVKTTQELLEDLACRSSSPSLLISRTESGSIQQQQHHQVDAKQEILAKFLQSQPVSATKEVSKAPPAGTKMLLPSKAVSDDPVAAIYARLPPLDPAAVWAEQSKRRQQQQQEEDEEQQVSIESPTPRLPVTDEDVDLLHNGKAENVNGTRDWTGDFHRWHETLTIASYHEEPLHLLPYVVIE